MNADRPTPQKRLIRALNRMTDRRLKRGLRLAALAGFALQPWLGDAWSPSREEFEEVFGPLDDTTWRRARRRIAAGELRNRAVIYRIQQKGPDFLESLIRVHGTERLTALRDAGIPVVAVNWNLGVVRATHAGLHALGYDIIVTMNRTPMHEFGYPWFPLWDPAGATRFLHEALKLLQSGGLPVVGLGPKAPQPHRIPFLGRSIPVPIGAGYLASRAGVRLMPVTATWAGLSPHINLTLHDPIPEPARGTLSQTDWEVEVVRAAIAWFGDYLRAHPEDLRPVNLRHLLQHLRQHPREPSQGDFDRLAESFAE